MEGLDWYLESRNWALGKIETLPVGTSGFDSKMYHYLYFVNAMAAVDLVGEKLKAVQQSEAFYDRITSAFPTREDFLYVRELRNAIVHRGLDPVAAGHATDTHVIPLCPINVPNRSGTVTYRSTFTYLVELATRCNEIFNKEIWAALETHAQLFETRIPELEEVLQEISSSEFVPEHVKAVAPEALKSLDWPVIADLIVKTNRQKLQDLLGVSSTDMS